MNEQQVVDLMKSSKNEVQWNENADKVKAACGGYPGFWFKAIMMSGLAHVVQQSWVPTTEEWLRKTSEELFPKEDVKSIKLNPPSPQEIENWNK